MEKKIQLATKESDLIFQMADNQKPLPIRRAVFHQAVNAESNFSRNDPNSARRYEMVLGWQGLICLDIEGVVTIVPVSNVVYMKT